MNPQQAFEILLNIPEPRRTPVLTDAATALRVSEILGLMWMDLDFFGSGDRSEARLRLGSVQSAQVQGFEGTRAHAPRAGRFLDGVEGENSLCEG
jgi:integrase